MHLVLASHGLMVLFLQCIHFISTSIVSKHHTLCLMHFLVLVIIIIKNIDTYIYILILLTCKYILNSRPE